MSTTNRPGSFGTERARANCPETGVDDIRTALAAEAHTSGTQAGGKAEFLQPLLAVFQHVEGYRHTWPPLSRKGGADVIARILRQHVTALVDQQLRSQFPTTARDRTQLQAATNYVVGACMVLLIWWLDNDDIPWSADEIHTTFRRLTTQGVRRFLTGQIQGARARRTAVAGLATGLI